MKLSQFLGVVLFSILLASILYYNLQALDTSIVPSKKEGFADMSGRLTACPTGTKTYTTVNGDINCCNGDVNGYNCNGKVLCTMSAPSKNIPSCSAYLNDKFKEPQATFCTSDLPNYFEGTGGDGGCTNGSVKGDKSAPVDPAAKVCNVWRNKTMNDHDPNSCATIKSQNEYSTPTKLVRGNCPEGTYKGAKGFGGLCAVKLVRDNQLNDMVPELGVKFCILNVIEVKNRMIKDGMPPEQAVKFASKQPICPTMGINN
jgi:hypothetical protein